MAASSQWLSWALLSAVFAALTAIFAEAGLQNISSDFATLVCTAMILLVLVALFAPVLHERPNSRERLGVGLVGAGIALMAFKR